MCLIVQFYLYAGQDLVFVEDVLKLSIAVLLLNWLIPKKKYFRKHLLMCLLYYCRVIFVNNFAFGPQVDHQVKEILLFLHLFDKL